MSMSMWLLPAAGPCITRRLHVTWGNFLVGRLHINRRKAGTYRKESTAGTAHEAEFGAMAEAAAAADGDPEAGLYALLQLLLHSIIIIHNANPGQVLQRKIQRRQTSCLSKACHG